MGQILLVRHGQASLFADNYDELSVLGREQARLLGEFWARRRIDFDEVYCGPRARQRQTAELAGAAFTAVAAGGLIVYRLWRGAGVSTTSMKV